MRIKEISMGRIAPSANKIVRIDPCRVAHTYKPSTQEKAAGEMLSLRPACVKLYHMKILSQRREQKRWNGHVRDGKPHSGDRKAVLS